jgi:plastocyanin
MFLHSLSITRNPDVTIPTFVIGGLLGLAILLTIIGQRGRAFFGRLFSIFFTFAVIAVVVGFFIWSIFINPNVGMTRTSFTRDSVNINTGSNINFSNPSDGVTQVLCVGTDQDCKTSSDDPPELDKGLTIKPGQTISVTFHNEGTYHITSKTTPYMNITIDVTTPSDDDSGD